MSQGALMSSPDQSIQGVIGAGKGNEEAEEGVMRTRGRTANLTGILRN